MFIANLYKSSPTSNEKPPSPASENIKNTTTQAIATPKQPTELIVNSNIEKKDDAKINEKSSHQDKILLAIDGIISDAELFVNKKEQNQWAKEAPFLLKNLSEIQQIPSTPEKKKKIQQLIETIILMGFYSMKNTADNNKNESQLIAQELLKYQKILKTIIAPQQLLEIKKVSTERR